MIVMLNPANPGIDSPPYFAVGENITFRWKYDQALLVAPKNISIIIQRPQQKIEVPLALNLSGSTTEYTWVTSNWSQTAAPLIESNDYRLRIFDERGLDANPEPGKLYPLNMAFSMYIPTGWQR
ncbi:hypothetical protein K7432_007812 [Basidiobolus ranarum]|uniref:DUF7137 domain-containing protein n=1 Tax=Basidiobolus ranarum TaxID=34480 RepID=A0ABR2VZK6_9FUNG